MANHVKKTPPVTPPVNPRSLAAKKAWQTMRSAVYKAQKVSKRSQVALKEWSAKHGYYCVFLDSPKGNPRTGIVDAVLVKVYRADADQLEFRLVQLKGGGAGLTARERTRLKASCDKAGLLPAFAFWDDDAKELEVDLPPVPKA